METTNLKKQAIIALRSFSPTGKNDIINIIETMINCYVKANQSNEESFMIEELQSFIDGINSDM